MEQPGTASTSYERVRRVLMDEMSIDEGRIAPDAAIAALSLDSIEFADLILELEKEFDCDVLDDDFPKLRTVQDIADYADKQLAAKLTPA